MKPNRLFEYIWLSTGILCFVMGINRTIHQGIVESYVFFILALVAIAMFYFRKKLREKQDH